MKKTRKLQFIGDSFYVALPPEWVKAMGLKKGDKLDIEYGDKPVVVITPAQE